MLEIIKKKSKHTIKSKGGKEFVPMNYFIVTDNNQYILIKPVSKEDYKRLDMVAKYVK